MTRELSFMHNAKQYECGSIVVFKDDFFGTTYERVFLCYIPDADHFLYQNLNGEAIYSMKGKDFRKLIVEVKDEICIPIRDSFLKSTNGYNRAPTFKEELVDDNLLIAWIWYVFIMMIAIIFNERIGIWILASCIFFNYRKKKLRERGFKL